MIYCLEGTPGVGKSLYMVSKLIPDYLKIRQADGSYCPVHIWTNIEGLKPYILLALSGLPDSLSMYIHNIGEYTDSEGNRAVDKRYLEWFYYDPQTIEWVKEYDQKNRTEWEHPDFDKAQYLPLNSLVILDELQNIFGSRDFDKQFTKLALHYITRHRHYGHNIFWASQNHEQVDVSFRRNTEQVWHLDGLDNFALFGGSRKFKISKYEGKFAGYQVNVNPYAVQVVVKDERYFVAYKSHVSGEVTEKKHTTNMWLNSKPLRIVALIMLVLVVLIVVNGNPLEAMKRGVHRKGEAPKATPPTTQGLVPVAGGERTEKKDTDGETEPCYTKYFINRGVPYVVLDNGRTARLDGGKKYHECE